MVRQRASNTPIVMAIAVGLATALLLGRLIPMRNFSDGAIMLAVLGGTLLLPIIFRAVHGSLDPFEPIVLFALVYGLMFVLRPAALLARDNSYVTYWRPWVNIESTLPTMIGLALIGGVAFIFGYESSIGRALSRRFPKAPSNSHADMVVTMALATAVVGLLLYGYFLKSSGSTIFVNFRDPDQVDLYRGSSSYFYLGSWFLVPSAVVLVGLGRDRGNRWIWWAGIMVTLVSLALTVAGGNRFPALPLISGLVVSHYLRKESRPRLVPLISLALTAVFLLTLVGSYRSSQIRQGQSIPSLAITILAEPERMIMPLTEGLDNGAADVFAAALTVHPEKIPFQYGKDFWTDLLLRPVPRSLWPEKPLTPSHRTVEALWPEALRVGLANPEFSLLLAFYRELGALGVAAGMFTAGVLARSWYTYFLSNRHNITVQLCYASSLPFFFNGLRDSPVDTLWHALRLIFPIWVAFYVAGRSDTETTGI